MVAARLFTVSIFSSPVFPIPYYGLSRKTNSGLGNPVIVSQSRVRSWKGKLLTGELAEDLRRESPEMGRLLGSPHTEGKLTFADTGQILVLWDG